MIRKVLKVIGFVFLGLIILLMPILFQKVNPTQIDPKIDYFDFPDSLAKKEFNLDSIKAVIGDNKGLPMGFEIVAAIAYSAYPELKEVNIDMVLTQSGAPMESNFNLKTLLGPISEREYRILLNNADKTSYDPILLRSLPFDAQVGILAHELGHVAYYDQLNTLQIAKWAIMYTLNPLFRAKHEKSTDLMPVYHGLGSQIYQYAYFVRNDPTTKPMYEKYGWLIDKFYLTDRELKEAIDNYHGSR